MDRSTEWPWSCEEEAEWKAELEERDYEFLEELIDSAAEGMTASSSDVLVSLQEQGDTPEKYCVTA
ncbi:MAG: hypothetical protein WAK89_17345 [Candidatus Sulfotelmatobacter sp.]